VSAGPGVLLARWQSSLELFAAMPPAITANLVNARLLTDVARVITPDAAPVQLRVLILWAARHPVAPLDGELARALANSVPGAEPVLTGVSLPTDTPAAVVREQVAGAHAVVVGTGYYDLIGTEGGKRAAQRVAAAKGWLAETASRLPSRNITIVVDGRATQPSDEASLADWIHQMAVEKLGMERGWPADVIVETPVGVGPAALAVRVLGPFRDDLAAAFAQATFTQVKHAIRDTQLRCCAIRRMTDISQPVPADQRWIWLQALAAGRLAGTMTEALQAHDPAPGPGASDG
jgi:hypothetical protein